MRQIIHTVRCLGVALMLVAAFGALSPAQPAAAMSRADVERLCDSLGGIYYESFDAGFIEYGCWLDDTDVECSLLADAPYGSGACDVGPFPQGPGPHHPDNPDNPTRHIGDPVSNSSQPAGGEVVDRYS
jgi:hypothetical protein